MVHQVTRFSDAFSAWENWNLTDFDSKCECLLALKSLLENSMPGVAKVISYHLQQASTLLAHTHQLIGPTGETNELYTAGRGVALIIQEDNGIQAKQAVVAQLTAALVAGNSVVFCSDDKELSSALVAAYQQSSLPANLLQFASFDAYHQLIESDVRCVGYVGTRRLRPRSTVSSRNVQARLSVSFQKRICLPCRWHMIHIYHCALLPSAHAQ